MNKIATRIRLILIMAVSILVSGSALAQSHSKMGKDLKPEYSAKGTLSWYLKNMKDFSSGAVGMFKSITDNNIDEVTTEFLDVGKWVQESEAKYSYSSDRKTITMTMKSLNWDTFVLEAGGTIVLVINDDGYPVSYTQTYESGTSTTTFTYDENGRVTKIEMVDDFEYEDGFTVDFTSTTTHTYITEDSVEFASVDNFNGDVTNMSGYYLNKDGNYVEVNKFVQESQLIVNSTTYYNTSMNEMIKHFFDDLYLVGSYTTLKVGSEATRPYIRDVLVEEDGKPKTTTFEYYHTGEGVDPHWDSWWRTTVMYNGDTITGLFDASYGDNGWEPTDYRKHFTYGASLPVEEENQISGFELSQNYPNPFNPATTINFSLNVPGEIRIKVYNVLGMEVAELVNEFKSEGKHQVKFNASNLPTGLYYYTLTANGISQTKTMMLMK